MWQPLRWQEWPGKERGQSPTGSPSQGAGGVQCSGLLSSWLGKAQACSQVRLKERGKGQAFSNPGAARLCRVPHAGRRTLLHARGYVSSRGGGRVSPGREPGPLESKAQEAATLPQHFFPYARERTPKALLGSNSEVLFAPSGKNSAKAQHSPGSKSRFFWLLLLA